MPLFQHFTCLVSITFVQLSVFIALSTVSAREPDAELNKSIKNAIKSMVNHIKASNIDEFNVGLAAYTLTKADVPADDPAIQKYLEVVLKRCSEDTYQFTHPSAYYVAATDALALEAIDPDKYNRELQTLADFIIEGQRDHGGWYYLGKDSAVESTLGDTSITQYSILGLWACQRAGIDIPRGVWNKTLSWLLATQLETGGGTYQQPWPPSKTRTERPTMSVAHCSSVGIVSLNLYGVSLHEAGKDGRSIRGGAKFGVLEKRGNQSNPGPVGGLLIKPAAAKTSVARSTAWLNRRHTSNVRSHKRWFYYYLYGVERTAAIHDIEQLNGEDWYIAGAQSILQTLNDDGTLKMATSGAEKSSVCFAILFLTKSTGKLFQRKTTYNSGAGLMAGGRGLPDDLKAVEMKDGDVKVRKSLGSLDDLLAKLKRSRTDDIDFGRTQKAVVEKIQLEDRENLVGQRERLLILAADRDPEIRRTALWALARCAHLEDSTLFFKTLSDVQKQILKNEKSVDISEVAVAIEARNALCWLSRRPLGLVNRIDNVLSPQYPYDLLPEGVDAENATHEQVLSATKTWLDHVVPAWKKWHLDNRLYKQRDDFEDRR